MEYYCIFSIKKEIYKIYKNNANSLYKTLYNLSKISKKDLKLGVSIYNEICNTIEQEKIKKYIKLLPITRNVRNKYLINKNIIIINPSRIIIKCKKINDDIIYTLKNYNKYLFICEFKKNNYYWLNEL